MALKTEGATPETKAVEPAVEKKVKSSIKYPPYVSAYGTIPQLFAEIEKASVPTKFNQDFMSTVLGLKSSSHRALIPLLKKIDLIDGANVPTDKYREYRGTNGKAVLAACIRYGYSDLYKANEYAHKLTKDQLLTKLRALTGAATNDENIKSVAGTFLELVKLADFSDAAEIATKTAKAEKTVEVTSPPTKLRSTTALGISYTINLNLPATTDIEVFNAIFKSLKEHILDEQ